MKQIKLCLSIYLNVQSYDLFFIFLHEHSVNGINANDAISARTYHKQVKLSTTKLRENITAE